MVKGGETYLKYVSFRGFLIWFQIHRNSSPFFFSLLLFSIRAIYVPTPLQQNH